MPERRRHDFLTPLLAALAVILALAFYIFGPFILVFSVSACVALLLAPLQKRLAALLGGRADPGRGRAGARHHGRHPRAAPDLALPARPPGRRLPRLDQGAAGRRARGAAALLGRAASPLPRPEGLDRLDPGPGHAGLERGDCAARRRGQRPAAERPRPGDPRRRRPRAVPADALLPAARRGAPAGGAAAGVALLGRAGAPDLRPPRADHQGRPAGGGRSAGGSGHPRRHRLHDLRRALAVPVGDGGDRRRDGARRRLAARVGSGLSSTCSSPGPPGPGSGSCSSASWW